LQDYLAKPVKGKVLEKMLVKWAIEGRRKRAKLSQSRNVEDHQRRLSMSAISTNATSSASAQLNDRPQISQLPVESETTVQDPALTELDRLHFENDTALAKSTETDGDRALRRIHAEEMASNLRDDKLLSLTGPELHRHGSYQEEESQLPLTQENMQKLENAADPDLPSKSRQPDGDSSVALEPSSRTQSMTRESSIARPSLSDLRMCDSEQTVTTTSCK
jgi:YesN/AraC family two-component response regulator